MTQKLSHTSELLYQMSGGAVHLVETQQELVICQWEQAEGRSGIILGKEQEV